MGKGTSEQLLVLACLAAVVLSVGARSHVRFAARTSYEETKAEDKAEDTTTTTTTTTTTPEERYPKGYPNAEHKYNPETGKYESSEAATDPTARYVNGYYNQADKYSDPAPITTVKSAASYYNEATKPTTTTTATKTTEPQMRYPAGYGPDHKSTAVSFSSSESDPAQGRYPKGYYAGSAYAGKSDYVDTSASKPVSFTSYQGNFNTLPMPSVGLTFVPAGLGCRTSYWVKNPENWPSFLKPTSTVGEVFGAKATEVFGTITILEGLSQYDIDPYKQLLRTGLTAALNSYTQGEYKFKHMNVVEYFNAALISEPAAKDQAAKFETANVESISAGNACV